MQCMHTDVDLRLLAGFLAVVDAGSVSAAAAQLNLSQPALSRQVRELERRLEVQLFERTPTRLTLTTAGHRFAPRARDLVARAARLASTTRQLAAGASPSFRVACPEATVRGVVAPFVAETGAPILNTALSLASEVYGRVLRREVDFAINSMRPPVSLASAKTGTAPLFVYVAADHPLATRSALTVDDLRGESLILLAPGSGLRQAIDRELWEVRDTFTIVAEPEASDLAIALAVAGHGVCIDLMTPLFGGVQLPLFRADGSRPSLQLYAAWEHDHFAAAEIAEVVDELIAWERRRTENYMHGNTVGPPALHQA